ncbi:MAG: hypothetical protein KatS3mg085_467 [Candidatus Dojkabacteria bacterium]|nr:MAG: hypothetical protein KatS3mg085_467 [Candidatus Dojkabacteria bacterium]
MSQLNIENPNPNLLKFQSEIAEDIYNSFFVSKGNPSDQINYVKKNIDIIRNNIQQNTEAFDAMFQINRILIELLVRYKNHNIDDITNIEPVIRYNLKLSALQNNYAFLTKENFIQNLRDLINAIGIDDAIELVNTFSQIINYKKISETSQNTISKNHNNTLNENGRIMAYYNEFIGNLSEVSDILNSITKIPEKLYSLLDINGLNNEDINIELLILCIFIDIIIEFLCAVGDIIFENEL